TLQLIVGRDQIVLRLVDETDTRPHRLAELPLDPDARLVRVRRLDVGCELNGARQRSRLNGHFFTRLPPLVALDAAGAGRLIVPAPGLRLARDVRVGVLRDDDARVVPVEPVVGLDDSLAVTTEVVHV